MDIAILITIAVLAFGFGAWFYRIKGRLDDIDKKLSPLIFLHKEELIRYYLDKGIMPNPSMTPRKEYLIARLEAGTISYQESQELGNLLRREERQARAAGNTDAVMAILGLIALVAVIAALSRQ